MTKLKLFRSWTVPLALLLACLLSYGLLIQRLGFYWDDWSPILVNRLYGADGFWKFYAFDRPSSAWTYWLIAPLLGSKPLHWQLFTLTLRWLTACAFWWMLCGLWPQARRQAAWAALLFAVYPVFTQQAISVTYHQLWLEYFFYFVSMAAMIQAFRQPRRFWLFTLLSLAAFALNLSISEYFLGVEMLRPVLLWLLILPEEQTFWARVRRTLRLWLPYILPFAAYIIWRLFFVRMAEGDPNKPYLLYALTETPFSALRQIAQYGLQDLVRILAASWYRALDPAQIDLSRAFSLFSWAVVALTAGLAAFYFAHLESSTPQDDSGQRSWLRQALLLGGVAVIFGPAPAWITGRYISAELFTDRFGATAMFGASLLLVAAVNWLTQRRPQEYLTLALLVGLAAGAHLRTANDYRWWWTNQTRFLWQLAWRAPYIEPNTALLSKDDVFPQQGRFATSIAVNLLYPQPDQPKTVAYWVFSALKPTFGNAAGEWRKGRKLEDDFRIFLFSGSSKESIVIYHHPEDGACLWVMSPENRALPDLPVGVRKALPLSNLSRIQPQSPQPGYPPTEIIGAEPRDSWCYYFEKADLARQMKDWQQVTALGDEARSKGYTPEASESRTPFEWFPFMEGYLQSGRWNDAAEITLALSKAKLTSKVDPLLCQFWYSVQETEPASAAKDQALGQVLPALGCAP